MISYQIFRFLLYFSLSQQKNNNRLIQMEKSQLRHHLSHPHFNRSNQLSQILGGTNSHASSHFADELERFQRDFAGYHKQEREASKVKYQHVLEKKYQQKQNLLSTLSAKAFETQQKQYITQHLNMQKYDMGLKKNGMTSGQAVNPINHQYLNSYGGKKLADQQSERQLSKLARVYNLQAKSTCGYNPINGWGNRPVEELVRVDKQDGIKSRIQQYQEHYRIRVPEDK